jgi:putative oxidoreductase
MEKQYPHLALRATLGALFFFAGIGKLMDPSGFATQLGQWGFPLATALAWVVIAVEVLGGLSFITGLKTKIAAWPLGATLVVALLAVHLAGAASFQSAILSTNNWWHIVGIAGLYAIYVEGPGAHALTFEDSEE